MKNEHTDAYYSEVSHILSKNEIDKNTDILKGKLKSFHPCQNKLLFDLEFYIILNHPNEETKKVVSIM